MDQLELRNKVVKKSEQLLVFVQTHNPKNPHIFSKLLDSFNFLISSPKFASIFKDFKLIKSERQPPNLARLLQKSNIKKEILEKGSVKCGNTRCGTCPFFLETQYINFHRVNIIFKLLNSFTCTSGDVIYKITCNGCGEYYIGLTMHLRSRVSKHKNDLFNFSYRIQKVHIHLHNCAGDIKIPFNIVPFYQCKRGSSLTVLLAIENYFIRKYKPLLNSDRDLEGVT